jgi:cysteine sulfinate desulfinase/cysteine desulfurase-like protein
VLRLSFGPETTEGDIDALYEALLRHKNTRFSML